MKIRRTELFPTFARVVPLFTQIMDKIRKTMKFLRIYKKEIKRMTLVRQPLFSQHGPEAMMAIAFTRRPSVCPSVVVIKNCGSF